MTDILDKNIKKIGKGAFEIGDRVRKKGDKGQWHGHIVGTYSTDITPDGYAVESVFERNSVQIYPASALIIWDGELLPTYKHKKRGTKYKLIGHAKLQTENPLPDMSEVVVYQGDLGDIWVRDKEEFFDGRFELLNEPSPPINFRNFVKYGKKL
jgi:R67 dihydrofolate reductase